MAFKLFKKDYEVQPIFSTLGTDMHCHLIPAVDDGSKCIEESLECLQTLKAVGYNKVYITPHFQHPRFPNDEDDIVRHYETLCNAVADAGIGIELAGIAGEYRIDAGFQARLDSPRFLQIANKYVLIEFPLHQQTPGADKMIFDMQMKGYDIILAHPERYPFLNIDGPHIERLLNGGALLQVNALSLGGFYGEEVQRRAFAIIERGWASFIGTDTHNTLYCQALRDLSRSRKVKKILEKYKFLNNTL